jgi:two-component system, chemotaxis family, sensor kinase Cph1
MSIPASPDVEVSMNAPRLMVQFRKFGLVQILVWSCILAVILLFIIDEYREDTIKQATLEARVYNSLNLQYRRWGARFGSAYAHTDKVASNPHLAVPERDVKTESGQSLTPINPAYMTRMVFEGIRKGSENPIISRLMSLNPLNPANRPTAWELETLRLFENREIRERSRLLTIDELPYLQFMAAFITEESCLKCHAHQGYKVGDVRGGMSIAIPISGNLAIEAEKIHSLVGGFALLWILGTAGIAVSSNRRHLQEMKIIEDRATAVELAERYSIVADGIPSLIAHVDKDERYIYVNRAYTEWVKLSREQIIGKTVKEIIGEDAYERSRPYISQVLHGRSGNLERQVTSDGRKIIQLIDFVPQIGCKDETIAYFALINDITERKQAEEELQKKNADIEQFMYTVSHDLRSPLVTVKTFMGYLEKDMADGNQEHLTQDIKFIHGAADKMKLMLDELLEMSRIDHVETPPVRVSFSEVVAEVLDALAGVIVERKVDIRLSDTDFMLFGDRSRLSRIWQNLIENAIKYSRNDGIPRIELGVQQVSGETVFFVKDNGIGIEPQYHSKIFGIFEKLDHKSPGAGMGLSMIQRIVEKCGGRVWAESEGISQGSCFFFTLPHAVFRDEQYQ